MKVADVLIHERDLLTTPVVDITNVAAYWESLPNGSEWDLRDLPNVAPPFPECVFEYPIADGGGRYRMAVRICAGTIREDADLPFFVCEAEGWTIAGKRLARVFTTSYSVDQDGKFLRFHSAFIAGAREATDDAVRAVIVLAFLPLLATSFMHCKNVTMREVITPAPLAKKQLRKRGIPAVNYHVLDIAPMTRVLGDEGRSESDGLAMALHICRGHFKTYTSDKPLFGNRIGTWWWDAAVRGHVTDGVALKDYRMGVTP